MREWSLVAFTLLVQTAVGLVWAVAAVVWLGGVVAAPWMMGALWLVGPLIGAAAVLSLFHLGRPARAWRVLANLRASWLSREILLLGAFGTAWGLVVALQQPGGPGTGPWAWATGGAAVLGGALVYAMSRVYRLRTVPTWDTRLTTTSFFLTTGSLGFLAAATLLATLGDPVPAPVATPIGASVLQILVLGGAACLAAELWLETAWGAARDRAATVTDVGLAQGGGSLRYAIAVRAPLLVAAMAFAGWAALAGTVDAGAAGAAEVVGTGRVVGAIGAAAGWLPILAALAFLTALTAGVLGRSSFYASYRRRGV